MSTIILESTLTCSHCGHVNTETMPIVQHCVYGVYVVERAFVDY